MLADPLFEASGIESSLRFTASSGDWRNSGTRLNVRRKSSERRVQSAEQSIGTPSHLCGFTPIESAHSHPAKSGRSSGHTAADPA